MIHTCLHPTFKREFMIKVKAKKQQELTVTIIYQLSNSLLFRRKFCGLDDQRKTDFECSRNEKTNKQFYITLKKLHHFAM
jgi:hypothetical protein